MYDLISNIIDHSWSTGSSEQQYVYYVCGAVIIILLVFFLDLVYRIFNRFIRG